MAFSTAAASILTGVGLGLQTYQGIEGVKAQKKAIRFQDEAQGQAKAAATSEKLRSQTAVNKADRKKPDIAALLAAAKGGKTGINSTFLSGSGGLGSLGGLG